jgi:peptidoglycan/xylan/chitin deacetylase (PgdA/CDA1 family)
MKTYRIWTVMLLGIGIGLSASGKIRADEGMDTVVRMEPGMTMVIQEAKRPDADPLSLLKKEGEGESKKRISPETEAPKQIVRRKENDREKILYLTFDDGPVEGTQNVLKILEEEGVEATLFCVGRHVQKRKNLYLRALQMPNLLVANHTYSHANGHYSRFYSNLWGVMSDVEHAQLILGGRKYLRLAGRNVWRLPEVRRNDRALSPRRRSIEIPKYEELAKEGFYIYGWDVEWHFDHNSGRPLGSARQLADRIGAIWSRGRSAQRGKVVLLAHDFMFRDAASTEELRRFVRIMKRRGWTFRKIDQYSSSRPEPLYVAKYYGKRPRSIVASATISQPSDAYRPPEHRKPVTPTPTVTSAGNVRSLQAQLIDAIRRYQSQRVDRLVAKGARLNQPDEYGRLALNTAVRANSIVLVKKLLSLGADMRKRDAKGYTALSAARSFRRTAIEKYLIEYSLRHGVKQRVVAMNEKKRADPLKLLRQ